jgi:hypothetical protein
MSDDNNSENEDLREILKHLPLMGKFETSTCRSRNFEIHIGQKNVKIVEDRPMAATAIHILTLDPMGKCSNAFFSETTNIIKANM